MLGALLGIGSGIGGVLGGAGKGAADARQQQNQFHQNENALKASLFNTQQGSLNSQYGTQQSALTNLIAQEEAAKLNRAQLGINAPSARAKQAVLGALIKNLQRARLTPPSHIASRMPQMRGGLNASALSPEARQAGDVLQRQALQALLSGSDIPAMGDFRGGVMTAPGVLPTPQMAGYKGAGALESIGSWGGLIGGLLGALRGGGQEGGG